MTESFTSFRDIAEATSPAAGITKTEAALETARDLAAVVKARQQKYQPFYGLQDPNDDRPREKLLRRDCDLVVKEFAGTLRKNQVRVLDLGCNAGYASFILAEKFPSTIGFDINPENVKLCCAIKDYTGSPAKFFGYDLMELVETGKADLENLDCVLLLNVIHQLIFVKGVPYVKEFVAKLAASVDFMVVELATRRDYVPHGKDKELPLVPGEIFELCTDSVIELVYGEDRRPIYTLRRRKLNVGGHEFCFNERGYSLHVDPRVNRKYYYGSNTFTKEFRYTTLQDKSKYAAELKGLQALDGLSVTPKPLAWDTSPHAGRICMERLYGVSLSDSLPSLPAGEKRKTLDEIVRIGAALASNQLYHNDLASHNFITLSDASMRLTDMETSGPVLLRDSFGAFLWLAHDILNNKRDYYALKKAADLVVEKGEGRVAASHYPVFDSAALESTFGSALASVVKEAHDSPLQWNEFIRQAQTRL